MFQIFYIFQFTALKLSLSNPETVLKSTHGTYLAPLNITKLLWSNLCLGLWSTFTLNLNKSQTTGAQLCKSHSWWQLGRDLIY